MKNKIKINQYGIDYYLLSKRGRRGDLEGGEEVMVGGEIGFIQKHACIEV